MFRVCVLSFLIFHIGNAASLYRNDYDSRLELTGPALRTNESLIESDSITIEARKTVDANGCPRCTRSYLVGKQEVIFNHAVLLCNQIGMEIASPTSAQEEKEIEKIAYASAPESARLWIGGKRCTDCLSEFIWISSGKPVVYRNFLANEPNNNGNSENCLEIRPKENVKGSYGWNDVGCDIKIGFVCQSRCCCNNN